MQATASAISLFSGAGGLDLGIEAAGFHVLAAIERDARAADTMEANFTGLAGPVIREDILNVSTTELLRHAGLAAGERPDLLVGGPPCTPFSKSGFWLDYKRQGLDPNASLLQAYTRVLREAKPRAFILENVYALTYNNKASRPHFERLKREITEAGYRYDWAVLNAADYGVAQLRPRLFMVGTYGDTPPPRLPLPTHTGKWERRRTGDLFGGSPHVTTGQALAGLRSEPDDTELLTGKWADLLPLVPPGDNYLHFTAHRGHPEPIFEWRKRYWSFLLKLHPDRPSPTIQAQPGPNVGPFHWESRRLRTPELMRLFGFPDGFQIVGSRSAAQFVLGNSVAPPVAEAVARSVATELGLAVSGGDLMAA